MPDTPPTTRRSAPMSDTWAVSSDYLTRSSHGHSGQPLCPACTGGRLHVYLVEVSLAADPGGWHGATALAGWIAVCVGSVGEGDGPVPACGFSMPMTPVAAPEADHA